MGANPISPVIGDVAQMDRAIACEAVGWRFKPFHARITQDKLIRQSTRFLPWGLGEFESPILYLVFVWCKRQALTPLRGRSRASILSLY